jgi:hypothetical protein
MNRKKYGDRVLVWLPENLHRLIPYANQIVFGNISLTERPILSKGKLAAIRLCKTCQMLINKTMKYNGWTKREAICAAFLAAQNRDFLFTDNETTFRELDEREARYTKKQIIS